ncbi:MAG: hypothetical protein M3418_13810 [Gemmatimonadota bacterium]|nr:hypothetical protein [Gemmatimonadota bacterium]
MFSLLLFGGASLRSSEQPLSGPVTQRRRLALLALLAVSGGRAVTRDRLIAQLWPESDTDRARHLLSESLYVIRKALGDDAVLAAGDELRLNPEVVATDVAEFEEALERGEVDHAVSLYRGPFLDGFFLGEAAEFERWAEGERTRLARCYERALDTKAKAHEAADDFSAAAEAWRQLAVADPYNSRVALQFMRALAATGDRAGALQHARVHTLLLREEFDAEPDPEIAAYAERLRTEPEAGEPFVSLPAAPAAAADEAEMAPSEAPEAGEAPDQFVPTTAAVAAPSEIERREPPGSPQPPHRGSVAPRRTLRPSFLVATAGLLLLVAGVAVLRFEGMRDLVPNVLLPATIAVDERSVAVLPFVDLTPQRDHEWFSDGMTEELINTLARIEGLRVAARTSAFVFKGKDADVGEIGTRLGVRHLAGGSVRKAGNRLRITVWLINVASGYHLWSETYQLDLEEDIFAVQDEISRAIVGTVHPHLMGEAAAPLVRRATTDQQAYSLYLQGRFFWNKRSPDGLAKGMELFQEALERDPSFALPYAGLADSYALLVTFGALSPQEGYPRAQGAAEQALALDSTLAEAHASLALVKLYYERDWSGADRQFRRAIALSPGYPTARHWYANFLAYRGEPQAAQAQMRRALELDPLSVAIQTAAGTLLYYDRQYDQAVAQYRKALEMEPAFWPALLQLASAHLQQGLQREALDEVEEATRLSGNHPMPLAFLGYSYAAAGRRDEARQILATLQDEGTRHYISPVYVAGIYAALAEHDSAFEWLGRGFEARDDWMIYLRADPIFDRLRSDPRFPRLLAQVGR